MIHLRAHHMFVSRDFSELQAALEDDVDPVYDRRDRRDVTRPQALSAVSRVKAKGPDAG